MCALAHFCIADPTEWNGRVDVLLPMQLSVQCVCVRAPRKVVDVQLFERRKVTTKAFAQFCYKKY